MRSSQEVRIETVGNKTPAAASRCLMRMLRTPHGMVLAYQADVVDIAPTLVFESTDRTVTLKQFPADWRRLSDEALLQLRASRDD